MATRRVLFLVLLIRFVCFLWELLVLPLYVILFRPFASLIARRRIKARCLTTNPAGPWRCIELSPPNPENPSSGLLTTTHDGVDSLYELFLRSASRCAERPCFGTRVILNEITESQADGRPFKKLKCGPYEWRKYREVAAQVASLSSGLRSIGLKSRDRIVIFCETRAEWMLTALAALSNSVTVVTLYATLGEQGILHGIRESEVKFMMTSMDLLPKLQRMLPELSAAGLETIVFAPTPAPRLQPGETGGESAAPKLDKFRTYTVEQLMRLGEANPAGANSRPSRDDLAFIVYTSGTTGLPKGVMLSHGNFLAVLAGGQSRIGATSGRSSGLAARLGLSGTFAPVSERDCCVAYLPLAHVLEIVTELFMIVHGAAIGYSSPTTLTDNSPKIQPGSKGDVSVLKPTIMNAVPAIVERISKLVRERVASGKHELLRELFDWSYRHKRNKLRQGLDTPVLNRVIFKKVRKILGGRVRFFMCGGAALSVDAQEFLNVCFACTVSIGYGLTETSGGVALIDPDDTLNYNRVGAPIASLDLLLRDWDEGGYKVNDKPNPRGEILVSGPNVAQGYFKNDEGTKKAFIDIDGRRWFATEDIGEIHPDGTVSIIDRKKDMLKLQHGEYVALGKVETVLAASQLVEQVCVCGRACAAFVVALVVPKRTQLVAMVRSLGLDPQRDGEDENAATERLCCEPKLVAAFLKQLTDLGSNRGLDKFEIPARIHLCAEMWMPDSGLLTDAMKLKRREFDRRFRSQIDALYDSSY